MPTGQIYRVAERIRGARPPATQSSRTQISPSLLTGSQRRRGMEQMTEPAPWHHFIRSMSFRHEAPIDKKHPHQPPFAERLAEHADRAVRDQHQQHDENAGEGPPRPASAARPRWSGCRACRAADPQMVQSHPWNRRATEPISVPAVRRCHRGIMACGQPRPHSVRRIPLG
jgi:hypothetical protein